MAGIPRTGKGVSQTVPDDLDDVPLIDASPPVAPPRHGRQNSSSSSSSAPAAKVSPMCSPAMPTGSGKAIREKSSSIAYIKGQVVKATAVPWVNPPLLVAAGLADTRRPSLTPWWTLSRRTCNSPPARPSSPRRSNGSSSTPSRRAATKSATPSSSA